MDNNKLLKFSIILSLIGIFLLFFLSKIIEIEPTSIGKIDESYMGKTVKIIGIVSKVDNVGNNTIFNVNNYNLELVIFSKVEIKKGENVSATGKVLKYNDNLQIQVDKLEKLS